MSTIDRLDNANIMSVPLDLEEKSDTSLTIIDETPKINYHQHSSFLGKLRSIKSSVLSSLSSKRRMKREDSYEKPFTVESKVNKLVEEYDIKLAYPMNNKPLLPSACPRPFSQFVFSTIKDEGMQTTEKSSIWTTTNAACIKKRHSFVLQQEQQTKQRQLKRPTVTKDFVDQQRTMSSFDEDTIHNQSIHSYTTSSSQSSSIKTLQHIPLAVTLPSEEEQSNLMPCSDSFFSLSPMITSRSCPQKGKKEDSVLSAVEVVPAPNLVGVDSQSRQPCRNISVPSHTPQQDKVKNKLDEIQTILSHPAFNFGQSLENQRFEQKRSLNDCKRTDSLIKELIDTEKSYNQLLTLIRDKYMLPMTEALKTRYPSSVEPNDILLLFNHLPDLIKVSDKLLKQLDQPHVNVGSVFRLLETRLVVFLNYTVHYRSNLVLIRRACNNSLCAKINKESLAQRDTNRLGINDYFIAPIQRVPRYCLFIQGLQKYISPLDPHYSDLSIALKIMNDLAVDMNCCTTKSPIQGLSYTRTL
ncbi:MAG: Dbl homology domain-containing protein [Benjaminiella poitrasii]|nr:MAG: Dbl homology domain-containing protein [Benjaminiella poitrasii]